MTRSALRIRRGGGPVAAVAALAVLAACTSGGSGAASPSVTATSATPTPTLTPSVSGSPSPSRASHVARIGVITSGTGVLASSGKGVRDSVELAVKEANLAARLPDWRFEVVAANDGSNQSGGQQAASGFAADDSVIGVVGTMRSTIDEGVQPILNNVGIPMISPGGTSATLTRRADGNKTVRPFPTYFRLSATDADQGPAGARYAKWTLRAKRVAIISDGSSYGTLLASGFIDEATRLKLARPVVQILDLPPDTTAMAAKYERIKLANTIKRAKVDVVFFGGEAQAAAGFATTLRAAKVAAPLMGGDELLGSRYLPVVGAKAAESDLATFPGAPATAMKSAADYVTAYEAAGFGDEPGPYGANAYDSARALILAFENSVGTRIEVDKSVRADVVHALDGLRFTGATGVVQFDGFGDVERPPLAVYEVLAGRWQVSGVVRVG